MAIQPLATSAGKDLSPSLQPTARPTRPEVQTVGSEATLETGFTLSALGQAINRRALWFWTTTLLVTGSIWGYTAYSYFFKPTYRSSFQMLVGDPTQGPINTKQGTSSHDSESENLQRNPASGFLNTNRAVDVQTLTQVLTSPMLVQQLLNRIPELRKPDETPNESLERIRTKELKVKLNKDSETLLEVGFENKSPQVALNATQILSQAYLNYNTQQRKQRLQEGIDFLNQQFPGLQSRVSQLQAQLRDFRQRYRVFQPEEDARLLLTRIGETEQALKTVQADLSRDRQLLASLKSQNATKSGTAIRDAALRDSQRYGALINQILAVESDIARDSVRYTDTAPNMQELKKQRANLLQLLTDKAANELQVLEAQEAALQQNQVQLRQQFASMPALAKTYADLQNQLEVATLNLRNFIAAREQLRLDAAQQINNWQIIAPPQLDSKPASPNLPLNLLAGLLLGTLAGAGVSYWRDRSDHVYNSVTEVRNSVNLPLLGTIPYLQKLQGVRNQKILNAPIAEQLELAGQQVKKRGDYYSSTAWKEPFRDLYTNIKFLSADQPIRSIGLFSPMSEEGATAVNVLLAETAAELGSRVLLVDADLRHPRVHNYLKCENMRGLSNYLISGLTIEDVVQPVRENLSVMTAGSQPPDPSKLLSSERMRELASTLAQRYDLVIYDMPPFLGMSDAGLLGSYLDGVVLLLALGKTDRDAPLEVLKKLQVRQMRVLGMVVNQVTPRGENSVPNAYHQYGY
jgi:capsular exopolysaccharide synthesis family protein